MPADDVLGRLRRETGDSGGDAVVDPFADLLFALAAAVLPVILVLLPAIHLAVTGTASRDPSRNEVLVDGEAAWVVVAELGGLRLASDRGRTVPLDRIPDDDDVRGRLADLRRSGRPLLLIVEPDGLESAFALEPMLAAFGPSRIEQVRASTSCRDAGTDALARACAWRGADDETAR